MKPSYEMRVLQVGKYFHPYKGGIETCVKLLSEGLSKRGIKVDIVASNLDAETKTEIYEGIDVCKLARWITFASTPICPSLIFKSVESYDLIHLHLPNPWAELCALKWQKPLVITYHSKVLSHLNLQRTYLRLQRRVLSKSKKILFSSETLLNSIFTTNDYRQKSSVIPFGVSQTEKVKYKDKKNSKCRFLFVGRLVKYKGLDTLLRAFKHVDGQLNIVGTGPEEDFLYKLRDQLFLKEKVKFWGELEERKLKEMYRKSDVFVLPSIDEREAFGFSALEAMSYGLPLITTSIKTGLSDLNRPGVNGWVFSANNYNELSEKMKMAVESPELRINYGEASYNRFSEKFKIDSMIDKHIKVYESIV